MEATTDTPQWRVTTCSSKECGQPIIWACTESGSRTPIDATPSQGGAWLLIPDPMGLDLNSPVAQHVKPPDRARYAGQLHTSHWATCPSGPRFRRRKP